MISRKNSEKFSTFKTMLEREFGQKKSDQPTTSSQSNSNLEIDTDGSGEIDRSELFNSLRLIGINPSPEELDNYLKMYDKDDNGIY